MSKGTWKRSLLAAGLLGYLVGSFPTADLVAKYARRRHGGASDDLRETGSGNPGALNAGKLLGRNWGLIVLVGDMIKGAAACVIGRALVGDNGTYLAGTTSVVGHCFPPWSRFRGGKGVQRGSAPGSSGSRLMRPWTWRSLQLPISCRKAVPP